MLVTKKIVQRILIHLLHLFSFNLAILWADLSEKATLHCAFLMRNGVKRLQRSKSQSKSRFKRSKKLAVTHSATCVALSGYRASHAAPRYACARLISAHGWVSSKIVIVCTQIGGAIVAHPHASGALAHCESETSVYRVLNIINNAAGVAHLIASIC